MKKRIIALLIATATMICAMPLTASAARTDLIVIGGQSLNDIEGLEEFPYELGVNLVGNDRYPMLSGGSLVVTKDNDDNLTVEMNNVTIDGNVNEFDGSIGISTSNNINIVLTGANKIINNQSGLSVGNITFSGTGSLEVVTPQESVYEGGIIAQDTIYFEDTVNVSVKSYASGIVAYNEIYFNMDKGGKVSSSVIATTDSYAVTAFSPCTIYINGGNKITSPTDGINYKYSDYAWYIANADETPALSVVIENPADKKASPNTSDSSDIAFYGMIAVLALAGAGFAAKKKFN